MRKEAELEVKIQLIIAKADKKIAQPQHFYLPFSSDFYLFWTLGPCFISITLAIVNFLFV